MVLAIDAGNSNIVFGCLENGDVQRVFRMATDPAKTEDEYAVTIKNILTFNGVTGSGFDGVVISSVVPPLTKILRAAVKKLTGKDAVVVGSGIKTGLNILIDDPAQLGADMVAGAVGAIASYKLPAIIVDLGTATKLSVIDKNGSFLGGAIFPGVVLSMNALTSNTSQLPKVHIEAPAKYISANTIDCMRSGAIFGNAAMIDGMVARFEQELGASASVIATGGLADEIYPHCKHEVVYDPNLLLRGLGIIYEKNKRK